MKPSATRWTALLLAMMTSSQASAEDGPALSHTQTAHTSHGARPPKGPPVVQPRRQGDAVLIDIQELAFYCEPAPKLSVAADETVLRLTVLPPEGPIARCRGAHSLTLQVNGVPKGVNRVVLDDLQAEDRAPVELAAP